MTGATLLTGQAYEAEHRDLQDSFARFIADAVAPYYEDWQRSGRIDPAVLAAAVEHGFAGTRIPEAHGGLELDDIRFLSAVAEEAGRRGVAGFGLALLVHDSLGIGLLADVAPEHDALEHVAAGCLTAPVAFGGEPVRLERQGADVVIDGAVDQVLGAHLADLLLVACEEQGGAHSLVLVPVELARATSSDALVGMRACGAANLSFAATVLPADAVLATGDRAVEALRQASCRQDLALSALAVGMAEGALRETATYVTDRKVFGQPLAAFENSRLALGDVAARIFGARAALDRALREAVTCSLSSTTAAATKLNATAALDEAVDTGVQLHGGYGYMLEYPIAHAYADARMLRLYGGSSEDLAATLADSLLDAR